MEFYGSETSHSITLQMWLLRTRKLIDTKII